MLPIAEEVKKVLSQFGDEILLEGEKFVSIMRDMAPSQNTELRVLRRMKDENLLQDVYNILHLKKQYSGSQNTEIKREIKRFDEELTQAGFSDAWKDIALGAFALEVTDSIGSHSSLDEKIRRHEDNTLDSLSNPQIIIPTIKIPNYVHKSMQLQKADSDIQNPVGSAKTVVDSQNYDDSDDEKEILYDAPDSSDDEETSSTDKDKKMTVLQVFYVFVGVVCLLGVAIIFFLFSSIGPEYLQEPLIICAIAFLVSVAVAAFVGAYKENRDE